MRILPILAISLLALPVAADNLQGYYAGAGLNFIDGNTIDEEGNDTQFRALEFHGGYKYKSWLGGEARVGFGISSETYAYLDGTGNLMEADLSIDHYESIYYRAESANTTAKLYGLLGFSNVQTSSDVGGESSSASESGASYGFGIGFVMNEYANLNFEFLQLLNSGDAEFTTFSIGFDYRF